MSLIRPIAFWKPVAAGVPFEIINAGLASTNSNGSAPSGTWTVDAETTLLIFACHQGPALGQDDFATLLIDGNGLTEELVTTGNNVADPSTQWWSLKNPPTGADLAITGTLGGANWNANSAWIIHAFNIRGEHATVYIGQTEHMNPVATDVASHEDSLGSLTVGSILLSATATQNGGNTHTPAQGETELADNQSGGSSTLDIAGAIGWKTVDATTEGYGWNHAINEGGSASAVEILAA